MHRSGGAALALVAAALLWTPGARAETAETGALGAKGKRPHVVLVLADDYGWGNFGVHRRGPGGNESAEAKQARAEVHTPNLDALVDEGVLLDRHYAYRICSPSRSALQSGRLAVHVNTENTGVGAENPQDPVSGWAGIPRNMTGMAAKLRGAGYRTHMVGKWDAGMATPEHTPQGRGYETWLGYFQHANDYYGKNTGLQSVGEVDNCLNMLRDFSEENATYRGPVLDKAALSTECRDDTTPDPPCYEEHIFRERALQIVRAHDTSRADAPLFLLYAFHLLHTPLEVPLAYLRRIDQIVAAAGGAPIDGKNRRLYAAMTLFMDEAVGMLVDALKAKGMWDDTLLVFSSDNGGPVYEPGAANNHPLRGGKYSDWEGGVRTNAFVSGGFVPAARRGSRFEGVVSISDWYGTLSELAGVDPTDHAALEANEWLKQQGLPLLPPVDSVAQWGFILNNSNGRREPLHLSEYAVLQWPYKLVTGKQVYSTWQGELYPNCSTINGAARHLGPSFMDFKVFGRAITVGETPEIMDRLTWAHDCGAGCLFNVAADPGEHRDLAQEPAHAERLASLQQALRALNQKVFRPDRGSGQIQACHTAVDHSFNYGPFAHLHGYYTPQPAPSVAERIKVAGAKAAIGLANKDWAVDALASRLQRAVWDHTRDVLPNSTNLTIPWDTCLAQGPGVLGRLRVERAARTLPEVWA